MSNIVLNIEPNSVANEYIKRMLSRHTCFIPQSKSIMNKWIYIYIYIYIYVYTSLTESQQDRSRVYMYWINTWTAFDWIYFFLHKFHGSWFYGIEHLCATNQSVSVCRTVRLHCKSHVVARRYMPADEQGHWSVVLTLWCCPCCSSSWTRKSRSVRSTGFVKSK